jgi:hypothetical protein
MPHCIAIFVANSLVAALGLQRPPIPSPRAIPAPRAHGSHSKLALLPHLLPSAFSPLFVLRTGGGVGVCVCVGGVIRSTASQVGGLVSTLQKLFRGTPCQCVGRKGGGRGGAQSLLTASRRNNPGAVSSRGPSEVMLLTFLSLEPLGAYRLAPVPA